MLFMMHKQMTTSLKTYWCIIFLQKAYFQQSHKHIFWTVCTHRAHWSTLRSYSYIHNIQNRPLSEEIYWLTGDQNIGLHIINYFLLYVKTFFTKRRLIWKKFQSWISYCVVPFQKKQWQIMKNRFTPVLLELCTIISIFQRN